jgi:hypothetical protein
VSYFPPPEAAGAVNASKPVAFYLCLAFGAAESNFTAVFKFLISIKSAVSV